MATKSWGSESEVLDRITQTWESSRPLNSAGNGGHLEQRLAAVVEYARIFVRWIIPLWPPQFLVRKIVRRLVLPFFRPQIEFNEAVRDVVLELNLRNNQLTSDLKIALTTVHDIEEQVNVLRGQMHQIKGQTKNNPVDHALLLTKNEVNIAS